MTGTLWGIGIGPGDPELLTAKAIRLLGELPVLAWPAPLDGDGMARTIAASYVPAGKVEIPIRLSFRPERDDTDEAYDKAAAAIAEHLAAGRDVGVLCEGDPLFFGSFIYVLTRLRGRFPVQVVPGVSSPMAAAAMAVRPLSLLDDAVAIIPATRPDALIRAMLEPAEAAVIMKVGRHLPRIKALLAGMGLLESAVVVERATLPDQRVLALAEAETLSYFSVILVHP
ncbi:precorrin-2 C(20)-methyltransferase [Magnetospirillum sp. 64-120]|uniref:precorrin-2 C(20)-methyltransferase n=1 Tax=Magnetospirillum sp. 64-120 TaxID=1895778 RepID=UPI0009297A95|nr:precorrin-2 C(20)-methyltransferase [Magnetospirillum sp. 64-120]OJX81809.1 MAG: precorrin-2 C(20)-methyltransferase [Magnetospirillum sp. 64-120]